ncbi:hypothetical protein Nepgr_017660 [Nepenthes gracilis]|uniref:Auxin response factor n=1 Tax=Nepenthes gracilis TaxID=150966 RepID=A0AAD3SS22_NEPGR|nr:hypothetical protein Nepgr_017660 [Nepenthes gracilis]
MGGLIDLNTVDEDADGDNISISVDGANNATQISSSSCSSSSSSAVCMELWHACAGPLISLPKKGSAVVYFPQGHLEHFPDFHGIPVDNIPPHVFCRVLDAKLHAEEATDEVYLQVSLLPQIQIEKKMVETEAGGGGEAEDIEVVGRSTTPHMFCKILTASDTSTHGGFSVPRRAAEDCFPPLDYKQQRPSQELIAKDLHGLQWRFRHIYRGRPRRHLLTTGWSAFVNKKRLVSGDAVLFLRDAGGELRLGIRRAAQVKGINPLLSPPSERSIHGGLETVIDAISVGRAFDICYNSRSGSSKFVVPLHRFLNSFDHCFSVGTRFRVHFEGEDAAERRHTGVIAGIGDADHLRWPNSKWRCLLVRWDDSDAASHSRVSPWEIEPIGSALSCSNSVACSLKRNRIGLPLTKPDFPINVGRRVSDSGEPSGILKILQGQEASGFNAAYHGINNLNHPVPESRCFPGLNCSGIAVTPSKDLKRCTETMGFDAAYNGTESPNHCEPGLWRCFPGSNSSGFAVTPPRNLKRFTKALSFCAAYDDTNSPIHRVPELSTCFSRSNSSVIAAAPLGDLFDESFRFGGVLQGQDTHQADGFYCGRQNESRLANVEIPDGFGTPHCGTGTAFVIKSSNPRAFSPSQSVQASSPSSVLMFLQESIHQSKMMNQGGFSQVCSPQQPPRGGRDLLPRGRTSCRLFGFSLTDAGFGGAAKVASSENSIRPLDDRRPRERSLEFTNAVGSEAAGVNELYSVRDRLLDIAL